MPAQMRTWSRPVQRLGRCDLSKPDIVTDEEPDHIFVFGADHLQDGCCYVEFSIYKAACTVAAIPVPIEQGKDFGIIVGPNGEMLDFSSLQPAADAGQSEDVPGLDGQLLVHHGITGSEIVRHAADESSIHDFGKSIISQMYRPPGRSFTTSPRMSSPTRAKRSEGTGDVADDTYFQLNMDLVDVEPVFNLYNDRWPIYTHNYIFRRRSLCSPISRKNASVTRLTCWWPRAV